MAEDCVVDPYSKEEIGPEHAIYLPDMDDMPDINDYVKAVGAVIGVRKIRSAYRKNKKIKMYLRYRSSVDEIAGTTVRVKGKRTIVNRAWADATRILITEVESEVPSSVIENALSQYGSQTSAIVTLGLHTRDPENSQIETNVRQVYMKLNEDIILPPYLEVGHKGVRHKLIVKAEYNEDACEQGTRRTSASSEFSTVPEVEDNVGALSPKIIIEPLSPTIIACTSTCTPPAENPPTLSPQERRDALAFSPNKAAALRHTFSGHSRVMEKGKQPYHYVFKRPRSYSPETNSLNSSPSVSEENMVTDSPATYSNSGREERTAQKANYVSCSGLGEDISNEQNGLQPGSSSGIDNDRQYPFNVEMFENFVEKVKNNRNPLDVALQMLEENKTPGAIEDLCHQIIEHSACTDGNGRIRLNRLLVLLSGGKFCL